MAPTDVMGFTPMTAPKPPVGGPGLERGKLNPTVATLYELATALVVGPVEWARPD